MFKPVASHTGCGLVQTEKKQLPEERNMTFGTDLVADKFNTQTEMAPLCSRQGELQKGCQLLPDPAGE